MMKTLEFMGEAIRNPKHPFRKTEQSAQKSAEKPLRAQENQGISPSDGLAVRRNGVRRILDSVSKKRQPVSSQPAAREKSPLAFRTDSKKFQLVGHGLEAVFGGDPLLNFLRETFFNLHDFRTLACRPDDDDGRRRFRRRVRSAPRRRQNQTASPCPFPRAGASRDKSSPGRTGLWAFRKKFPGWSADADGGAEFPESPRAGR